MKIFSAEQIKKADATTIAQEPISSLDLMERAGKRLTDELLTIFTSTTHYIIFAGPGNNGGDGLVMARYLKNHQKHVQVYILQAKEYTAECTTNIARLHELGVEFIYLNQQEQINQISCKENAILVDALFGNGLNRVLDGLALDLVKKINSLPNFVVAVDVPSGLSADAVHISTPANTVVANFTLTIEFPKLSFFFAEHEALVGSWKIIPIELDKNFIATEPTSCFCLDAPMVSDLIRPRPVFAHKGSFGHALLVAGSKGKIGASVLAGHAAVKTGCGLLTMQVPSGGVSAIHTRLPEAMVMADGHADYITNNVAEVTKYNAIGFGPGAGQEPATAQVLKMLIQIAAQPLVIDADGINILAQNSTWLEFLNGSTILTPHPGEFDRLTKKHNSGVERWKTQLDYSKKYGMYIVLKGHHTSITTPGGLSFFNTTGNNGMATGGSGDVLTGIITSLCAQGYSALHACLLGVYLHGYAGDRAAEEESKTSLIATDIITHISTFFKTFEK
jgi:NAD(P)H-hydrate epimerase